MISFECDGAVFNYRVGGLAFRNDEVLLCSGTPSDFWFPPGGRAEIGEESTATLAREIQEELAIDVQVGRLLWMVENFFVHQGRRYHELSLIYLMELPGDAALLSLNDFTGDEGGQPFYFRWFSPEGLNHIRVLPGFLAEAMGALPPTPMHVIHRDAPTADQSHCLR